MPGEEALLATYLFEVCCNGLREETKRYLLHSGVVVEAEEVLRGERLSNGWWEELLKRNPDFRLCAGDLTANVRFNA